jgi:amino acid transporter
MAQELKKTIKLRDYFMLGFGSIVGVGWAVSLSGWIGSGGGTVVAMVGYIIATIMMVPIGLCYAELTPAMPVAGGSVAFTTRAFGKVSSFIVGWFVILAYANILPWEAININNIIVNMLLPKIGIVQDPNAAPLYILQGSSIFPMALVIGILTSFIIVIINWRGTEIAVKFQTFCSTLILCCGAIVIIFSLIKFSPDNMLPAYQAAADGSHTTFLGGLMVVLAMAPFFLAGFDTIPQGAEEGSEGLNFKNLGKVLLGSVLSAGAFYVLIIFASGSAMPWEDFAALPRPAVPAMFAGDGAAFGGLYAGVLGQLLYWITMIGALAGLITTWNGFYIASARLVLGMARARLLPKFFTTIHHKYGTPVGGNLVAAVFTFAGPFLGVNMIDPLTIIGSAAFMIGWFYTSASAVKLRVSEPNMNRPFKMPGGSIMGILGMIISLALFLITIIPSSPGFMTRIGVTYFIGWTLLGIIFYIASTKYRNAIPETERVAELFKSMNK